MDIGSDLLVEERNHEALLDKPLLFLLTNKFGKLLYQFNFSIELEYQEKIISQLIMGLKNITQSNTEIDKLLYSFNEPSYSILIQKYLDFYFILVCENANKSIELMLQKFIDYVVLETKFFNNQTSEITELNSNSYTTITNSLQNQFDYFEKEALDKLMQLKHKFQDNELLKSKVVDSHDGRLDYSYLIDQRIFILMSLMHKFGKIEKLLLKETLNFVNFDEIYNQLEELKVIDTLNENEKTITAILPRGYIQYSKFTAKLSSLE
ncbi:MAG: hypothetical protein OEZ01_02845 [Candidatus Heimdallarchaeota archaeon]|nr:hypothetical protein [Candidatus Heimdallarchaeota archaeon]MDH5644915.1 hypothetical protein [Candidatus Heimdallarchaeota archaeon]